MNIKHETYCFPGFSFSTWCWDDTSADMLPACLLWLGVPTFPPEPKCAIERHLFLTLIFASPSALVCDVPLALIGCHGMGLPVYNSSTVCLAFQLLGKLPSLLLHLVSSVFTSSVKFGWFLLMLQAPHKLPRIRSEKVTQSLSTQKNPFKHRYWISGNTGYMGGSYKNLI